jgi:hypothetical protein
MARSILAVIASYLAMAVGLFLVFTAVYLVLGANRAFQAGSYQVSMVWILASFVISLAAALGGGYLCATIAKSMGAPKFLAGLVLVIGLLQAGWLATHPKPDPGARAGDVPNLEAMMKAQTPTWVMVITALIGAGGVMIGARARIKD